MSRLRDIEFRDNVKAQAGFKAKDLQRLRAEWLKTGMKKPWPVFLNETKQ